MSTTAEDPKKAPVAGPVLSLETLKSEHADIYQAAYNEGQAAGKAAEMQRIKDVEAAALPGHEALIESLKFDGSSTGGDAAQAVLKAERENRDKGLTVFSASAPKPVAQPAQDPEKRETEATNDDLTTDEGCKAAWEKDAALRAEFSNDFDSFLAYAKANAGGLVKVLSSK